MRYSRRTTWTALALASVLPVSVAVVGTRVLAQQAGDPSACKAAPTPFQEELKYQAPIDATRANAKVELWATNGTHSFHPGLGKTDTLGYATAKDATGDLYGGPTIVAKKGNAVQLTVHNSIQAHPLAGNIPAKPTDAAQAGHIHEGKANQPDTVVHLHGGITPADSDGGPTDLTKSGADKVYTYPNQQSAAGLWYHDHAIGMTRLNVAAGLAGSYWVRDAYDTGVKGANPSNLPTGEYEWPLMLQDRSFKADASSPSDSSYCYGNGSSDIGRTFTTQSGGNATIVNGKAFPKLKVKQGVYRFHVVNGSNATPYSLRLNDPAGASTLTQIGSDQGLLNTAVPVTADKPIDSWPGQRADVLIDFSKARPGTVTLDSGDNKLMQFEVQAQAGEQNRGNTPLRKGTGDAAPLTVLKSGGTTRTVTLGYSAAQRAFVLNGMPFGADCTKAEYKNRCFSPQPDTVEDWYIVNNGGPHPIHLHATNFQVIGTYDDDLSPNFDKDFARDGVSLKPSSYLSAAAQKTDADTTRTIDPRMIDTVTVPYGVTHIRVQFHSVATGNFVWHCHILEHEDNDMMQEMPVGTGGTPAHGSGHGAGGAEHDATGPEEATTTTTPSATAKVTTSTSTASARTSTTSTTSTTDGVTAERTAGTRGRTR